MAGCPAVYDLGMQARRVLARNGSRFLVETDAGDALYDLVRDELEMLEAPVTRESLVRFDPYWEAPVDPDLRGVVRLAAASSRRTPRVKRGG